MTKVLTITDMTQLANAAGINTDAEQKVYAALLGQAADAVATMLNLTWRRSPFPNANVPLPVAAMFLANANVESPEVFETLEIEVEVPWMLDDGSETAYSRMVNLDDLIHILDVILPSLATPIRTDAIALANDFARKITNDGSLVAEGATSNGIEWEGTHVAFERGPQKTGILDILIALDLDDSESI